MKKVLVVNVNWLGDVIFSSPVFKAIKENYPESHVACLAVPRVKEILESIPGIDEIIIYDERGAHRGLRAKVDLVADLRRRQFDVAFLLHGSLTRALLVYFARIPQRVGYGTKNRGRFLTFQTPSSEQVIHRADHYLRVIEPFVKVKDRSCSLTTSTEAQEEINQILKSYGIKNEERFLILNVGGNWDLKRWPKENFRQLARWLTEKEKIKIVIPGSFQDRSLAEFVAWHSNPLPVILTGKTNLKQLIALFKRAKLVVSADSGPLHMADAVGTPTLALFGPTRPEITGPRGKGKSVILQKDSGCNRSACYYLECPDNVCMKMLTVEEVFSAIQKMI